MSLSKTSLLSKNVAEWRRFGRRISGKYEVDFNTERLQGQFSAKEQKPTQKRVCE